MHTPTSRSIIAISAFVLALSGATVVFAQTGVPTIDASKVSYPIAELGSCKNQSDCRAYCEQASHMQACVAYAEKQGLLTGEDLRVSKIVAEKIATKQTPGGCTSKQSCETYCAGNVVHLKECVAFGEELGVIPSSDLAEAKKIMSALEQGAQMPGGCKTKGECESYCAAGAHIDECLSFAEASGILSPEKLAEAKKVAPFLKSGETPGGCQSKDACEAYCADNSHFDQCLTFAQKAGFVSAEDAAIARKTGGVGPGGCKGKDACEAYCNDEAHAAECLAYAKEKGLLSAEDEKLVDNGIDQMKQALDAMPAEARTQVMGCLNTSIGNDEVARLLSKQDVPTKQMGDKIKACFANVADIIKRVMMEKAGAGAGGQSGTQGPPSAEEVMKSIPDSVPTEMRTQIEQQIQQQIQGAGGQPPAGMPSGSPGGVPSGPPAGAPTGPSGGQGSAQMCASFAAVPSCDYIPAGQARDLCVQCKSQ
jgi:hypothetical protein